MARIHSHRRGKSQSTYPSSKRAPTWVNYSQDEIVATVGKLSKEGLTPSQIGMRLRDDFGIPNTKIFLGKTLTGILEESKSGTPIPEDLGRLVERAAKLKEHLGRHHADRKNVRSLELLEAKIHRLSSYYKSNAKLPSGWKYSVAIAQLA
ncbi:MAG: 30S ribosomal protein S15 [Nitrososphaerota archaeon]|nr:30S ribosomal protein S15 [Nitrososphaerota archaeon]